MNSINTQDSNQARPLIGVLSGSIREGRNSIAVAKWIQETLSRNDDAEFELIDLAEIDIPPLTDSTLPMERQGQYEDPKITAWAELIKTFDGFIFATPEYNASIPGTMKNAFDSLYVEWNNKPVGFVGWGGDGAQTSIRHWHDVAQRAKMAVIDPPLHLPFKDAFPAHTFTPTEKHAETLQELAKNLLSALASQ